MSNHLDPREHDHAALQHEAEHERPPRRKSSVLFYLVILFAAAFLLLLMSYFMQQRANQEVISGLENKSVSAVQSLDSLLKENESLKQQVTEMEEQNNALKTEASAATVKNGQLSAENDALRRQAQAMDWLWRIQRSFSRGAYRDAREMVEQFEATGLVPSLPTLSTDGTEGRTPAEQYQAILEALN